MRIEVRITPNSSRDEIAGFDENGILRVRVQAPPVEGAANKRLIRLLARTAQVSKSKVKIVTGEKARSKLLEIQGDSESIMACLRKNI